MKLIGLVVLLALAGCRTTKYTRLEYLSYDGDFQYAQITAGARYELGSWSLDTGAGQYLPLDGTRDLSLLTVGLGWTHGMIDLYGSVDVTESWRTDREVTAYTSLEITYP